MYYIIYVLFLCVFSEDSLFLFFSLLITVHRWHLERVQALTPLYGRFFFFF